MGYGKNLKEAADAQGITLRKLGLMTGISPQTLYGAVKRDNGLRYDHAIIIADALRILPEEICGHALASAEDGAKYAEGIEEALLQIKESRRRGYIRRHLGILRTYDEEHLKAAEELLDRFGKLDLSGWRCMKEMMEVVLRYSTAKPKEESMDWRKELKKTAGVTDEGDAADLTDMEGREFLDGRYLEYLKNTAADGQKTDKG